MIIKMIIKIFNSIRSVLIQMTGVSNMILKKIELTILVMSCTGSLILGMKPATNPLFRAIARNDNEEVMLLLTSIENPEQKANFVMTTKDKFRRTPLHEAATEGNEEIVTMLMSAVQNQQQSTFIEMKDTWGFTALDLAIRDKRVKVLNVLVGFYQQLGIDLSSDRRDLEALGINVPHIPSRDELELPILTEIFQTLEMKEKSYDECQSKIYALDDRLNKSRRELSKLETSIQRSMQIGDENQYDKFCRLHHMLKSYIDIMARRSEDIELSIHPYYT